MDTAGMGHFSGRAVGLACALLAAVPAAWLAPSAAYAGDWMQVSCVNPTGSIAPSEGWTNFDTNTPEPGSNSSTGCGPGSPMYADRLDTDLELFSRRRRPGRLLGRGRGAGKPWRQLLCLGGLRR
jgi:hypothetical protein